MEDIEFIDCPDTQMLKTASLYHIQGMINPQILHCLSCFDSWGLVSKLKPTVPVQLSIGSEILLYSVPQLLQMIMKVHSRLNIVSLDSIYFVVGQLLPVLEQFLECFENVRSVGVKIGDKQTLIDFLKLTQGTKIRHINIEYHGLTVGLEAPVRSFINTHFDKKIAIKCVETQKTIKSLFY